jgi:purine-nucleoside phosphorylase
MTEHYRQVAEAAEFLRRRVREVPRVGLVLGSGLGGFADAPVNELSLPYTEIPHFPVSKVAGHAGKLVLGRIGETPVAVLSGRVHHYEGHSPQTITFAVRTLGLLGVRTLVLTNAAGGVSPSLSAGSLMIISDHVNLMGVNPLIGENDERFGPRFPDMSEVYTLRLRDLAARTAELIGLPVGRGVYAALPGPNYETPAEIRFMRVIGVDAVGMSTVPEAIVARHMGLDVLGISCITNMAAGVLQQPLDHHEVMETARRVREHFIALLAAVVGQL